MEVDQRTNTDTVNAKAAPVPLLDFLTERQRIWGVRVGVVVFGSLWLFLMAAAWSQADEIDSAPQSSDEYNFKWLDPDKKIYVLQNRRYQKAKHALFSVTGGPDFGGNAYTTSWSVTPRLNYFFSTKAGASSSSSPRARIRRTRPLPLSRIPECVGLSGGA